MDLLKYIRLIDTFWHFSVIFKSIVLNFKTFMTYMVWPIYGKLINLKKYDNMRFEYLYNDFQTAKYILIWKSA